MLFECEKSIEVCKRAFYLAYEACCPASSMGILQARSSVTEDDIWEQVTGQKAGDYCIPQGSATRPTADYVFGKMMKLRVELFSYGIKVPDSEPRGDYQSWCWKYPAYQALFEAANKEING